VLLLLGAAPCMQRSFGDAAWKLDTDLPTAVPPNFFESLAQRLGAFLPSFDEEVSSESLEMPSRELMNGI